MKKILIIGGTGSTGLYLTDYLDKLGYKLSVTGMRQRQSSYYETRGISYTTVDISKHEDFSKLPTEQYDCVVLLAGMMPARMRGYDPYKYIKINVIGTLNVLEYCRRNNIGKLIFAQSHSDVAGHWNTGKKIAHDADRKINLSGDHAIYIVSKCAAVDIIENYHLDHGIQNIVLRLPTVYCYWPDPTFYVNGEKRDIAYLKFINQAINGDDIEIWGDPSISKDIVYVKDLAQIVHKAIESGEARGIYNVGSGDAVSLDEQVKTIINVFSSHNRRSKVIYRPDMPSQHSYFYDITRTKTDLGYLPLYPYTKMVEDMKAEMGNPILSIA